jgi:hypothetical protein
MAVIVPYAQSDDPPEKGFNTHCESSIAGVNNSKWESSLLRSGRIINSIAT